MVEFRKYANNEGITETTFEKKVTVYCPLGENMTTFVVNVVISLGETYCDMLDVEQYLTKELNGKELTQEGTTAEVFGTFKHNYEPKHLRVDVTGDGHILAHTIMEA